MKTGVYNGAFFYLSDEESLSRVKKHLHESEKTQITLEIGKKIF